MPCPSMKAIMSSFTVVRSSGMGDIKVAKAANFYCMPFERGLPLTAYSRVGRRPSGHELHKHAIKLLGIDIELNFYLLRLRRSIGIFCPGQGVAVCGSVSNINAHKPRFGVGDNRGIEPRSSGKLVPHDVGPGRQHGELREIVRDGS